MTSLCSALAKNLSLYSLKDDAMLGGSKNNINMIYNVLFGEHNISTKKKGKKTKDSLV